MGKHDFQSFSQELDTSVLDLVKKKRYYSYEYISCLEKSQENLLTKEKLKSSIVL